MENFNTKVIEDSKITYEQFGKESAASAQGNPHTLRGSLNIIYNEIIKKATLDENQKKEKIKKLSDDRTSVETEIIGKNTIVQTKELEKKSKQKELDDLAEGRGHVEIVPFVLSAVITTLLTFFLWIFYSGSSYGAINSHIFKNKIDGMSAIFTSLGYLIDVGTGIEKAFYGLFPIIFIGLGFLIHDGLTKKKYFQIVLLLIFTFFVDLLIGYKISAGLYMVDPINRLNNPWQPQFVVKNSDFYLILACGFASYIIWGFLLNSTLQKFNDLQPTVRQQQLIRDIGNIEIEIARLKGECDSLNNRKKEIIQEIEDMGKNVVYISVTQLKALIGYFMAGWGAWLQLMKPAEATAIIAECNDISEKWLNTTLAENDKSVVFKQ
jgi:hypothetical protein